MHLLMSLFDVLKYVILDLFYVQECEDFETVADFEVLVKSSHGHMGVPSEKDEFNNHKDHNQEKPSKFKQRYSIRPATHFADLSSISSFFVLFL